MKICVITGTRAEYGLLYWLLKEIQNNSDLELQLIVTGMHLSSEFGLTYKEIEKEFKISKKIEILLSSDTPISISKSIGLAQISYAEAFDELKPDTLVVLGDRYEILPAATAALISRIPICHLYGGELTEGVIDDAIRHAITKMSHLHFTSTEIYKKRVIQLGENPEHVFNVGGIGIDNIKKLQLLSKEEFEYSINFKLSKKNLLVTFHPVTLEENSSKKQFEELLISLSKLKETNIIFTKANSDTDGRIINQMIDEYVSQNKNTIVFTSLGQLRYLSALQFVDAVVGNSSSGIMEVPSFKIPTINIGDRQKGRIKAESIIDCMPNNLAITLALEKIYSSDFKNKLININNPFGEGGASKRIIKLIKEKYRKDLLNKQFYDFN